MTNFNTGKAEWLLSQLGPQFKKETNLRVKFWRGWLRSETMKEEEDWLAHWIHSAKKAEAENSELVVFKIPKNTVGMADPDTIKEIEELLQLKYPKL